MDKSNINNLRTITDERVQEIISQVEADGGKVAYIFLRGSFAHGTDVETSDKDYGMFYVADVNNLLDMGFKYKDEYKDPKNDVYCQEIGKFCRLLLKSNPTVLESLFVDDEFVVYEHPLFTELKKYREMFLTKDCYGPFMGYAKSQLAKGSSQNKAVMKPLLERKTPLDFCYTIYKNGSTPVRNWLEYRGLNQKYIGAISVPNMMGYYCCHYDWGNFFKYENITLDMLLDNRRNTTVYDTIAIVREMKNARETGNNELAAEKEAVLKKAQFKNMVNFIIDKYKLDVVDENDSRTIEQKLEDWYNSQKPIGFCGLIREDGKSTEIRFIDGEVEHSQKDEKSVILCSVPKESVSICHIFFNKNGFSVSCREWKEQQEWIEHRNPERFRQNVENMKKFQNRQESKGFYDSKNFSQLHLLLSYWIEIVRDGKFIVNRRGLDREYLLSIKRGELTYNEIIDNAKKKIAEAEKYMETSTLPEHCDAEFLNKWLLDVRHKQLKGEL